MPRYKIGSTFRTTDDNRFWELMSLSGRGDDGDKALVALVENKTREIYADEASAVEIINDSISEEDLRDVMGFPDRFIGVNNGFDGHVYTINDIPDGHYFKVYNESLAIGNIYVKLNGTIYFFNKKRMERSAMSDGRNWDMRIRMISFNAINDSGVLLKN